MGFTNNMNIQISEKLALDLLEVLDIDFNSSEDSNKQLEVFGRFAEAINTQRYHLTECQENLLSITPYTMEELVEKMSGMSTSQRRSLETAITNRYYNLVLVAGENFPTEAKRLRKFIDNNIL